MNGDATSSSGFTIPGPVSGGVVFPRRRRPLDAGARLRIAGGAGLVALDLLAFLVVPIALGAPPGLLTLVGIILAVLGLGPVWRGGGAVRVGPDGLELPVGWRGRRAVRVPFDSVESILDNVASIESGRGCRAVIGTRRRTFVLDGDDFEDDAALPRILFALRHGIAVGPDGPERLRRISERRHLAWRLVRTPVRATRGLLGAVGIAYAIQYLLGGTEDPLRMLELGANAPALVADGQLWRLVSAGFLHGGIVHVAMNGLALWVLGRVVEHLVGPARLLAIYAAGALGGAVASTLAARAMMSVGASTAVFGLLGALAVIHLRYGVLLPAGIRQSRRWWIVILGLNGAISLIPMVDAMGHLGGFLAGGLCAWPLLGTTPGEPEGRPARTLGVAAILVLAAGVGAAAVSFLSAGHGRAAIVAGLARSEETDPRLLNELAWTIAIDPAAPDDELAAAERAARAALAGDVREDYRRAVRDTLATVLHRRGRREEAVREQAVVLRSEIDSGERGPGVLGEGVYATQLARFAAAGPTPLLLDGAPAVTLENDETALHATADSPPPGPLLVVARDRDGADWTGVVVIRLPAEGPWSLMPVKAGSLEVVLVMPDGPDAPGEAIALRWPVDEETVRLP